MVFKSILFGLALIAAVCAVFIGGFLLIVIAYRCGWEFIRWLRDVKWREKAGHLRRSERIDRFCKWLECGRAGSGAGVVEDEELQRLDGFDGDGGGGSVGGETLFEGDEIGDGEAMKKEEVELNSKNYMKGMPMKLGMGRQ